ncbi:MAG: phenylacetic acid degradation operon negative regulatory protein PaaX [Pseudomonadota bacterium]
MTRNSIFFNIYVSFLLVSPHNTLTWQYLIILTDTPTRLLEPLFRHFMQRTPLRTGSLIVTILGDSVAPRGGVVWLGSLIQALAPLGISHRLVRTAAYRLVQDGILCNQQAGRKSYYTLTDLGHAEFAAATKRIYATPAPPWDEHWCLLLTQQLSAPARTRLRRDLDWLGFAAIGADLLAHPQPDRQRLDTLLKGVAESTDVIEFRGQIPAPLRPQKLRSWVRQTWQLERLADAYSQYLKLFQSVQRKLASRPNITDADAFYLRTFVIHEYRKVLLRDPGLPEALLPTNWQGHAAYTLTRSLYQGTAGGAERYISNTMQSRNGPLPPADENFYQRFGGLTI